MIKRLNFFAAAVIAFSAAVFIFSAALAMPSYAYFNSHTAPRLNRVSICGVGTDGESIVISPASVPLPGNLFMGSIFVADPVASPSEFGDSTVATPSDFNGDCIDSNHAATPSEYGDCIDSNQAIAPSESSGLSSIVKRDATPSEYSYYEPV